MQGGASWEDKGRKPSKDGGGRSWRGAWTLPSRRDSSGPFALLTTEESEGEATLSPQQPGAQQQQQRGQHGGSGERASGSPSPTSSRSEGGRQPSACARLVPWWKMPLAGSARQAPRSRSAVPEPSPGPSRHLPARRQAGSAPAFLSARWAPVPSTQRALACVSRRRRRRCLLRGRVSPARGAAERERERALPPLI